MFPASRRILMRRDPRSETTHHPPPIKGGRDEVPPEVQGEEPCPPPQRRNTYFVKSRYFIGTNARTMCTTARFQGCMSLCSASQVCCASTISSWLGVMRP